MEAAKVTGKRPADEAAPSNPDAKRSKPDDTRDVEVGKGQGLIAALGEKEATQLFLDFEQSMVKLLFTADSYDKCQQRVKQCQIDTNAADTGPGKVQLNALLTEASAAWKTLKQERITARKDVRPIFFDIVGTLAECVREQAKEQVAQQIKDELRKSARDNLNSLKHYLTEEMEKAKKELEAAKHAMLQEIRQEREAAASAMPPPAAIIPGASGESVSSVRKEVAAVAERLKALDGKVRKLAQNVAAGKGGAKKARVPSGPLPDPVRAASQTPAPADPSPSASAEPIASIKTEPISFIDEAKFADMSKALGELGERLSEHEDTVRQLSVDMTARSTHLDATFVGKAEFETRLKTLPSAPQELGPKGDSAIETRVAKLAETIETQKTAIERVEGKQKTEADLARLVTQAGTAATNAAASATAAAKAVEDGKTALAKAGDARFGTLSTELRNEVATRVNAVNEAKSGLEQLISSTTKACNDAAVACRVETTRATNEANKATTETAKIATALLEVNKCQTETRDAGNKAANEAARVATTLTDVKKLQETLEASRADAVTATAAAVAARMATDAATTATKRAMEDIRTEAATLQATYTEALKAGPSLAQIHTDLTGFAEQVRLWKEEHAALKTTTARIDQQQQMVKPSLVQLGEIIKSLHTYRGNNVNGAPRIPTGNRIDVPRNLDDSPTSSTLALPAAMSRSASSGSGSGGPPSRGQPIRKAHSPMPSGPAPARSSPDAQPVASTSTSAFGAPAVPASAPLATGQPPHPRPGVGMTYQTSSMGVTQPNGLVRQPNSGPTANAQAAPRQPAAQQPATSTHPPAVISQPARLPGPSMPAAPAPVGNRPPGS